jgi:hypothetical protein
MSSCARPSCESPAALTIADEKLCTTHAVIDQHNRLLALNTLLVDAFKPSTPKTWSWSGSVGYGVLALIVIAAPFLVGAAWGLVVIGYRYVTMLGPS